MSHRFDIVIAGASATGLALALALHKALDGDASLAVVERTASATSPAESPRAFALTAASRNLLEALGVWNDVAPQSQAVTEIEITDSPLEAGVRPVLLTCENRLDGGDPASHIVPDAALADALRRAAEASGIDVRRGFAIKSFEQRDTSAELVANDGRELHADLVVAADGGRGPLRDLAGIRSVGWGYGQSGICAVVAHERPHGGRATQHFLPSGPFAILPLPGHRSCITWSERTDEARRIMALDDDAFLAEAERRFSGRLGAITLEKKPASWPLTYRLARSFVGPRLALVGDAARAVHPLAGQGLNLGFRDVAALAEILIDNARIGLPLSDPDGLARYERWRRFDSTMSSAAFDTLNRLFANDNRLLRSFRELGLGLVDRLPIAKSLIVREAAGLTGDVPRLLRGERL